MACIGVDCPQTAAIKNGGSLVKRLLILSAAVVIAACAGPYEGDKEMKATKSAIEIGVEEGSQAAGSVAAAQDLMERLVGPGNKVEVSKMDNGWFEVRGGGSYGYIDPSTSYFIEGDLVNLRTGDNITDVARKTDRVAVLQALEHNMITFAPKNADPRYTLTVFTDTECGYCRKLHHEINQYLDAGITVKYVLYARGGLGSSAYRTAEKIWCSDDRKAALTAAKAGQPLGEVGRCETPLAYHQVVGERLAIQGTPTGFLPDGEIIRGYMPAEKLRRRMEAHYGVEKTRVGMR